MTQCQKILRLIFLMNEVTQKGRDEENGTMASKGDDNNSNDLPVILATPSKFRYNSPLVQTVLIGFVCFCCPGMFNALNGMGGAGQVKPTASNNANTALYTTFSVFGVLGGGIYNILGPQLTLLCGCSTYVLYAGSYLYYNHYHQQGFVIFAGAFLGMGAGLLWAAQGAILTSCPPQNRKGTYFSLFWSIFNLGGVIGGLIPFLTNYHRKDAKSVNDGTYIGFMVFMSAGTLLSLSILHPRRVVRNDGTRCTNMKYSNVSTEAVEILKLFLDWKMLLLVPASWTSNFFYSYQFNNVNGALFNLRTRGFNNVFYWAAQMVGSIFIGYVMDFSFKSRRARGVLGVGTVAVLGTAIWSGGFVKQQDYTRDNPPSQSQLLDFKDGSGFAGPFMLYFSYGLLDAMFQTMIYWVLGALADDSQILSRYVGFYKGVQSAGGAVAWQIDTRNVGFKTELLTNWILMSASYPFLLVVILKAVKDKKAEEIEGNTKEDGTFPGIH